MHLVNVMADAWEVYLRAKGAYNIKPLFYVKKIYIVSARGAGARGAGAMTRIGVFKKGFVALREPEGYMTYTAPRLRAPRAPRGARVELALYDHYLEKPASFSTTSPRSAPRAPPIMVPPATNNSGVLNSSM